MAARTKASIVLLIQPLCETSSTVDTSLVKLSLVLSMYGKKIKRIDWLVTHQGCMKANVVRNRNSNKTFYTNANSILLAYVSFYEASCVLHLSAPGICVEQGSNGIQDVRRLFVGSTILISNVYISELETDACVAHKALIFISRC